MRGVLANLLQLPSRVVHVWRIGLEASEGALGELAGRLDATEQSRAARFVFPGDRRRYMVAHAALRDILAGYLGEPPAGLRFQTDRRGKPYLIGTQDPPLRFNLAHSGEIALVACAWGEEVGVDVEAIRPMPDLAAIAGRFFAPGEQQALLALPPEEQTLGFFNCWTRKEAFIKAVGEGLGYPLDQFETTLRPGAPARFVTIGGDAEEAQRWSLTAWMPAPGYVAGLAVRRRDWPVHHFSII